MLLVDHISKKVVDSDGELTILDAVHFTVQAHETVAIIGASGSGKSTLLSIMAGLDKPSYGTISLGNLDLFALNEDQRAKVRSEKMAFVFQSFQLLSHLNALENVSLPLELQSKPHAKALATDMLIRVGLGERLKHYPKVLSGGEQQRVALARAFVTAPQILFADEPTGSLDSATGERIMKLMFELNQELGTTLVLVTHDVNMAKRCNCMLHLEAGKLVA
jgi:putative ABC transport system ATP-binding protein